LKLLRRLREQTPATQAQAQFICAVSAEVGVGKKNPRMEKVKVNLF